ncbi:MAG: type II toxin-antitoxin system VapC family toxin [Burkholderiaceae bacterium]
MQLLLDTQVFLWFLADSRRLTRRARRLIGDAQRVFVSSASIWECCMKIGLGRLDVDPAAIVAGIEGSGFDARPISPRHALATFGLPKLHKDPFDRMLIAQTVTEGLVLLTADRTLEACSALVRRV